jgi:hypothetical protein
MRNFQEPFFKWKSPFPILFGILSAQLLHTSSWSYAFMTVGNIMHWRFPANVTVWAGPMSAATGWYLFDLPIGGYGNANVGSSALLREDAEA